MYYVHIIINTTSLVCTCTTGIIISTYIIVINKYKYYMYIVVYIYNVYVHIIIIQYELFT